MQTVILVPSVLSFLGGGFMLISFVALDKLRNPFGKISMWFAICGIGNALHPWLGFPAAGSALCYFQSFIGTCCTIVMMLTSTIIVTVIYQLFASTPTYSRYHIKSIEITPLKILYAWGLAFVLSALPFTTGSYGPETNFNS
jgi:hypothetical protein